MIVGLTGRNGSGKGTVAKWFEDRGFHFRSLSDAIRGYLRDRGLDVSRDNLIAGGRRLRSEGGPGVLAERTLKALPYGRPAVIDSIRNPAEVEVLRGRADFVLLEITADERVRYDRMVARNRGGDARSFDEFRRHEQAELSSTDSAAQQLHTTAELRDLEVPNDSDIEALHARLAGIFPGISGDTYDPAPVDVLITGGAGFIGTEVCAALVERGDTVRCMDVGGFARMGNLADHERVDVIVGDVLDPELIGTLVSRAGIVMHLAAVVGVDRYLSDPEQVLDVNIGGSRNVMRACLAHDVPVMVASTSEVYGARSLDLRESMGPDVGDLANSRWSYSISKATVEQYAHALGRRGLRFVVTRYFNVYGALLDHPGAGRVLGKFLGCIQAGEPLPLVDGGQAVRAFCHIDDALRAILGLLDALPDNDAIAGRAFNIGRDEPVTIAEFAARVVKHSGHPAGTVDVPAAEHFGEGFEEIPRRVPDVRAIREAIGFEATISLDEGLRSALDHWGLLADDDTPASAAAPVPFIRPCVEPDNALLARLAVSLQTGHLTNRGAELRAFEAEIAGFLGGGEAIATSSGSGALLLSTLALGARGKAVLPSFTYIATLNAVVWAGLEPVFCDIDPGTWTMCPEALRAVLAEHDDVGLVVPVNVYGVPPDLTAITRSARESGAEVLYDNAHGFGTEVGGARLPADSPVSVYSLHATKVLPAVEGGAIVTSDPALVAELRRLCNHGLDTTLTRSRPGFNFKMSELHAAVGRHSLAGLTDAIARRRHYAAALPGVIDGAPSFANQRVPDDVRSNNQNLTVTVEAASGSAAGGIGAVARLFDKHGVGARRYFHPPLHDLELYAGKWRLPTTDDVCSRLLCLPMWSRMDDAVLQRIAAGIRATDRALAAG